MRIILVASRYPMPAWRGNQVRTGEWLAALADHEVRLVCPEAPRGVRESVEMPAQTYPVHPLGATLGLLTAVGRGVPFQEGLYGQSTARRALSRVLEEGPWDLAIVQMLRCGWAADLFDHSVPGMPWLFDSIDSMSLHFSRADRDFPALLSPLVRLEARRCRRRERFLTGRASLTTAVARRDLDAMGLDDQRSRVVPVAAREIRPDDRGERLPTVLLSGNLGYRPTVRAAVDFARQVWPQVSQAVPEARWVLAGARPASKIRRLAELPGIEVHGDVPDLGAFLGEATVAVAPMASGSGIPMKVLEAWAADVPVVAHPLAAAGLETAPAPGVKVAERPEEWVSALVRLLEDRGAAARLADRGRAVWSRFYSPDRVRAAIVEAVETAVTS